MDCVENKKVNISGCETEIAVAVPVEEDLLVPEDTVDLTDILRNIGEKDG